MKAITTKYIGPSNVRGLLRKGTVVHTHDAGAARWGRPVEKREGRGKVVDHFRDMAGRKTPPYLVRFEDGTTSWYDVDEVSLGIDPTTCSGTGEGAATRALSRSGSPKRFKIIGLTIGHTAVTMHRIPASPHDIPSGSVVTVEEILKLPGRRSKGAFGTWTTSGKAVRVRFGYRGASYWADEGSLEPTGAPGLSSPKRASRAAHRAPGNALGHLLHEGASKVAKLFTSKKGRAR